MRCLDPRCQWLLKSQELVVNLLTSGNILINIKFYNYLKTEGLKSFSQTNNILDLTLPTVYVRHTGPIYDDLLLTLNEINSPTVA